MDEAGKAARTLPENGDLPLYAARLDTFRGRSLEESVALLADREEIRDLIATYALRAARGVPMADLFTDDGAFITHVPGKTAREVRGREALDQYYRELAAAPGHPMPMIHNHLIAVDGDQARGICSVELRTTVGATSMIGSGYYDDSFRREGGRWKFVERDVHFHHLVPLEEGWSKPASSDPTPP